jgi:hypothetical protein
VAIKFCGKLGMFFTCAEAFRFETTLMTILDHPFIMKCYGANETHAEPFIVMPLQGERKYFRSFLKLEFLFTFFFLQLEMGSLTQVMQARKGQIPIKVKLHLCIQLAEVRTLKLCFFLISQTFEN